MVNNIQKLIDKYDNKSANSYWSAVEYGDQFAQGVCSIVEDIIVDLKNLTESEQKGLIQARLDYKYLRYEYEVDDFYGAFCNTDRFNEILLGETTIKDIIVELIKYYFKNCKDLQGDIKDDHTREIKERYNI